MNGEGMLIDFKSDMVAQKTIFDAEKLTIFIGKAVIISGEVSLRKAGIYGNYTTHRLVDQHAILETVRDEFVYLFTFVPGLGSSEASVSIKDILAGNIVINVIPVPEPCLGDITKKSEDQQNG